MAVSQTWQDGIQLLTLQTGRIMDYDAGQAQIAAMPIKCGTYTVVAGAATVTDTAVTANSQILITLKTVGGTVAAQLIATITPGTGFTTTGGGSDSSTYNYCIIG